MKQTDIFKMCWDNLFRRKARTFLSVLGVMIGCCSIMIMLSISVGMTASQTAWIEEMGDLSVIEVYPMYSGVGENSENIKLNEDAVKTLKAIEYVETVAPKLSAEDISFVITAGNNDRYEATWAQIIGYDYDVIEEMGYELVDGKLPAKPSTALMGQFFEYSLADSRRPEGSNMIEYYMYDTSDESIEMPDPYVDLLGRDITIQVRDENGKAVWSTSVTISGKIKEDYAKGYETSQGLILRKDDLEKMIVDARKALGQKSQELIYSGITVKVSDISMVSQVEKQINDLGYLSSSMESMRESTQKEMATVRLVLGGIGAVSLFVAAIGITNTMIMSVSERTKEIGVMKAIGCFVGNVREIFLVEAGFIGLLGGVIGSILSFLVSCVINYLAGSSELMGEAGQSLYEMLFTSPNRLSVIPLWLLAFGLSFSFLIGVLSGFYPANKAVKVSAMEAMRNE